MEIQLHIKAVRGQFRHDPPFQEECDSREFWLVRGTRAVLSWLPDVRRLIDSAQLFLPA